MKATLPLLTLLATSLSAAAQSPITLTQATFPAAPGAVERYQNANVATTTPATPTGANQTWDYRSLTPISTPYTIAYLPVPAGSPIAGAQWTRARAGYVGPFSYNFTSYYALGATGRLGLGRTIARQAMSLSQITGGANDSVVVSKQTISFGTGGAGIIDFPLPITAGSRNVTITRVPTAGTITAPGFGLNKAPFTVVQRYYQVDSVAGWGTARIPVAGNATGSAPLAVLQVRERFVEQDSIYLNGAPAPALLLLALGLTQGSVTGYYYDSFWRTGSVQPVLDLYYANKQYGVPTSADYSTESTLLASRTAAFTTALQAYPNPAALGAPVVLAADGRHQAVALTVRDVLGRALATGTGTTGEATSLLAGLPQGSYLLEISAADGQRNVQRITVQ